MSLVSRIGGLAVVGLGAALLVLGSSGSDEAHVSRVLAYPLERPVRFALEAEEQEIRLVTWAMMPPDVTLDPRSTVSYGVQARVLDPTGHEVHRQVVRLRSHHSRLEAPTGALLPATWLGDPPRRVADDRVVRLALQDRVPRGGVLELEAVEGEVLASVYRRGARTRLQTMRLLRGDEPEERARIAARATPFGWEGLPPAWQERAVRPLYERLGALAGRGERVDTRRLQVRNERVPLALVPAQGSLLPPGGAVAFNLQGEGRLEVRWWDAEGEAPQAARYRVRAVGPEGTRWEEEGEGHGAGPWTLEDDLVSLHVALEEDRARTLRAGWSTLGPPRAWGLPPILEADGEARLGPELRTLEAWRADAGVAPLWFALQEGERARVILRPRLAEGAGPGLQPGEPEGGPEVRVALLDAEGAELGRHAVAPRGVPSAFERYVEGPGPLRARVAEPEVLELAAVPGGRLIRVEADGPVEVQVRVRRGDDPEARPHADYPLPDDLAVAPRYVPVSREAWSARSPLLRDGLEAAGRMVRVDLQVRLEPRQGEGRPWRTLQLPQPYELLAEASPVDGDGEGGRVPLREAPSRVVVPPSGRLVVDYRVGAAQVGATIRLRVGDQSHQRPLHGSGGQLRVDGLPAGPVTVATDAPGAFFAATEGPAPWRVRRAWSAAPGRPLRVEIPPDVGALLVASYAQPGRPVRLAHRWVTAEEAGLGLLLQDGVHRPARRSEGVVSLSSDGRLVALRPVPLALPDREVPLVLELEPEGGPVLLRLLAAGPGEEAALEERLVRIGGSP